MTSVSGLPPGVYRVEPGLLAGAHPTTHPSRSVASLESLGVGLFVNLTEPAEERRRGHPAVDYRPDLRGARMVRFPTPDLGIPASMDAILDEIASARESGEVVYVHCMGGVGRTGTVVGCWLAQTDAPLGPLARLDALRQRAGLDRPSPETEAQRRFVAEWGRDPA